MMISQIWWYADIDRNFDVMVERYQMKLDMCDTDIDTDWSDKDAVVAVCIISDMDAVMDCNDRNVIFMVYFVSVISDRLDMGW